MNRFFVLRQRNSNPRREGRIASTRANVRLSLEREAECYQAEHRVCCGGEA